MAHSDRLSQDALAAGLQGMQPTLAFCAVTIVAVLTSCLAYVFDWNETHGYNPNWPPHAKFHNAQTLLPGPLLGAASGSLYWIAQLGSLAFPGTALAAAWIAG